MHPKIWLKNEGVDKYEKIHDERGRVGDFHLDLISGVETEIKTKT